MIATSLFAGTTTTIKELHDTAYLGKKSEFLKKYKKPYKVVKNKNNEHYEKWVYTIPVKNGDKSSKGFMIYVMSDFFVTGYTLMSFKEQEISKKQSYSRSEIFKICRKRTVDEITKELGRPTKIEHNGNNNCLHYELEINDDDRYKSFTVMIDSENKGIGVSYLTTEMR